MQVAVLAHGSRGDIQPMVAVADALMQRGHTVRMTVNSNATEWVRRCGIDVVPFVFDAEAYLRSPGGKKALADGKIATFFRTLAAQEHEHNQDTTRAMSEACEGADLVLSTIMTAFRGVSLGEALGVPHAMLSTMPIYVTGAFTSYLARQRDLRVRWLNKLTWRAYLGLYWMGHKKAFNDGRRALGLAPWRSRPALEHEAAIHMYSHHLVPLPDDCPNVMWQSDFAPLSRELRARLGESSLPDGLEAWLDAGPPPVFFGFGSMPVLDPAAMLALATRVSERHGVRALIGAGWTEYELKGDSERVFIAPAFDHDQVLPRCRAAVHHGGAGTTHVALRAGCPSLICSIFADQPLWGHRVAELGVGATFPFQKMSERRLSDALELLLTDEVAQRAADLGARLRDGGGAARTVELIERFAAERA